MSLTQILAKIGRFEIGSYSFNLAIPVPLRDGKYTLLYLGVTQDLIDIQPGKTYIAFPKNGLLNKTF